MVHAANGALACRLVPIVGADSKGRLEQAADKAGYKCNRQHVACAQQGKWIGGLGGGMGHKGAGCGGGKEKL